MYDMPGSLRRNFIPAMGTIFNLRVWARVAYGLLFGKQGAGSLKAVFFEGYLKDDAEM